MTLARRGEAREASLAKVTAEWRAKWRIWHRKVALLLEDGDACVVCCAEENGPCVVDALEAAEAQVRELRSALEPIQGWAENALGIISYGKGNDRRILTDGHWDDLKALKEIMDEALTATESATDGRLP